MLNFPFFTERNTPGEIFERQIEFRREKFQVERPPPGFANTTAIKEFNRHQLAAFRLLLQRNEKPSLLAPGPNTVLVYKCEPKTRVGRQRDIEEAFVARNHLEANSREHYAFIGDDGRKRDVFHTRLKQMGRLVTFKFQWQTECRFT